MKNNGTLALSRHFTAADGTVGSVIIVDSEGRFFQYWNGCQPAPPCPLP